MRVQNVNTTEIYLVFGFSRHCRVPTELFVQCKCNRRVVRFRFVYTNLNLNHPEISGGSDVTQISLHISLRAYGDDNNKGECGAPYCAPGRSWSPSCRDGHPSDRISIQNDHILRQ
jgi:hypothetical protein